MARDAGGDHADDGHAAGAEHRHVPRGRFREGPAAVQPADVSDGRHHRHVRVPDRDPVQQLQLRDGRGPLRVDHRTDPGAVGERDIQTSSRDEPVVTPTSTTSPIRKRSGPTAIRDSASYRTFRVVNTLVLIGVMVVTLYPFVNILAQSFSAEGYIVAGQVNLVP